MPASHAATSARSVSRGWGVGWVVAMTMPNWSALATRTRSTGSVSSALRRSTWARAATRTMRARSSAPAPLPMQATRSPTTTARRPSSRALTASRRSGVGSSPGPAGVPAGGSRMRVNRPRSTAVTTADRASRWAGRSFVRGRLAGCRRRRMSSSSGERAVRRRTLMVTAAGCPRRPRAGRSAPATVRRSPEAFSTCSPRHPGRSRARAAQ